MAVAAKNKTLAERFGGKIIPPRKARPSNLKKPAEKKPDNDGQRQPGTGTAPAQLARVDRDRILVDRDFDFRPFINAPACLKTTEKSGWKFAPIRVRRTLNIPSPLADNIHPGRLPEIKTLCEAFGRKGYNGSNQEVWLSWKRAYDLWNNHYIEGRVNVKWVQESMEKMREKMKNRSKKRKWPVETKKTEPPSMKVYERRSGLLEELPDPGEGRKWIGTTDSEVRKVLKGTKYERTQQMIRKKKKKGNVVGFQQQPFLQLRPSASREGGEEEGKKPAMELVKLNFSNGDQNKGKTYSNLDKPSPEKKEELERIKLGAQLSLQTEGAWVQQMGHLLSYDDDEYEEVDMEKEVEEVAYSDFWFWDLVDNPDALKALKKQKLTKEGPPRVMYHRNGKSSAEGDEYMAEEEEEEDNDEHLDNWKFDLDEAPGSSGGFVSMRVLAAGLNSDDNEDYFEERIQERVENTVWRPRRVGEEPQDINGTDVERAKAEQEEANESDFARFRPVTEFEVDGGVDCATAPFPASCSLTSH